MGKERNPYHDKNGRFTTGSSHHADEYEEMEFYDAANKREKRDEPLEKHVVDVQQFNKALHNIDKADHRQVVDLFNKLEKEMRYAHGEAYKELYEIWKKLIDWKKGEL